jgi:ABC-type branched-subunit amino acid transport system substrate-binding protein
MNVYRTIRKGLAFLFVVAATIGTGHAQSSDPILIGVPEPLSGSLAAAGTDVANAARLAAEHINNKGGVLGRKIEVRVVDDACDAQQGVQVTEKLVTQGIIAVAGGFCSGSSIPESAVARRHGNLPFLAPGASNPKLTEQGYTNVYRLAVRDDQEAPVDIAYMTTVLGVKRVAFLHDNTTYSKGLATLVRDEAEKAGLEAIYFDAITPGTNDYTSTLTAIASKEPELLFYGGYYAEFGLLIKQWKSLGLGFRLMGGGGTWDPVLLETAGTSANDPKVSMTTAPLGEFNPGTAKIAEDFKARFGTEPGAYAVYEYDAISVLVAAIDKAQSTDAEAVNNALHEITYEGLTGTINFDGKGDRQAFPFIQVGIVNGKFVKLATYDGSSWTRE